MVGSDFWIKCYLPLVLSRYAGSFVFLCPGLKLSISGNFCHPPQFKGNFVCRSHHQKMTGFMLLGVIHQPHCTLLFVGTTFYQRNSHDENCWQFGLWIIQHNRKIVSGQRYYCFEDQYPFYLLIIKQKLFPGSSLSSVRICCFPPFYVIVNKISWGFGLFWRCRLGLWQTVIDI